MNILGTFTKLRSLSLLRHLSNCHDTTCLHVLSNSVTWLIYLEQGKIIYATHSIEPFDRLERHLRRLDHQLSALSTEIRVSVRLMFETDSPNLNGDSYSDKSPEQPPEYQAICWLVSQRHINPNQAAILIQEMVKEALESFSVLNTGNYKLISIVNKLPIICKIDTEKILAMCDQQLRGWQSLTPHISSPYQRPYLRVTTEVVKHKLSTIHQNLATWMKGFSLRHLAVIVNQDEVEMARQLYPYITSGEIVLHEPDPPFDKLPSFDLSTAPTNYITDLVHNQLITEAPPNGTLETITQRPNGSSNVIIPEKTHLKQQTASQTVAKRVPNPPSNTSVPATNRKVYKIVSVDDSPTVLREISRFLEHENFSVVTINDPVKAVMSIIRNKPDLILLDLNMDGIDGYELCKIIRNNSMFKKTPIIMVTGNKGLVDKVKARFVGASGYLTKPFTQTDLLKMVFMHLT